jgi:hypothetical protein
VVDEKPQIQALNRTAPLLPLRPGTSEGKEKNWIKTVPGRGWVHLFALLQPNGSVLQPGMEAERLR